jgi:hypothetical protein
LRVMVALRPKVNFWPDGSPALESMDMRTHLIVWCVARQSYLWVFWVTEDGQFMDYSQSMTNGTQPDASDSLFERKLLK